MQSMEAAMGFDMTPNKKRTTSIYFTNNDDFIKQATQAIEDLDYLNIAKMCIEKHSNEQKRMISKLNDFVETYIPKNTQYSNTCESYLNDCIISLETRLNEMDKKRLNEQRQVSAASGLQWFVGILRGFDLGSNIGQIAGGLAVGSGKIAGAGVSTLLWQLAFTGIGTVIQGCKSCDPVKVGQDILNDPKCKEAIKRFKLLKGKDNMCTVQELKNYGKTIRTRTGFLNAVLTGDVDGKNINIQNKEAICIKSVDGVTVVVSQLLPFYGSNDLRQLRNLRVLVVTAIYKSGKKLKSKNIARGYIEAGGDMNRSSSEEALFKDIMDTYCEGMESLGPDLVQDSAIWAKSAINKIK